MTFDEWITVMTNWYFNGGATLADVIKRAYEKGVTDTKYECCGCKKGDVADDQQ